MSPKNILRKVEIGNISAHGLWLLVNEREFFMSFKSFPWFKKATIAEIQNVELNHSHHLYWPDLDIDLHLSSLEKPEAFPLVANVKKEKTWIKALKKNPDQWKKDQTWFKAQAWGK